MVSRDTLVIAIAEGTSEPRYAGKPNHNPDFNGQKFPLHKQ